MARYSRSFVVVALLAVPGIAAVPQTVNHQGVIRVQGDLFSGTGQFRFAIFDPDTGQNYWTNDNTFVPGPGTPTAFVPIAVADGVYSVRLGDTSLTGMTNAIPPSVFNDSNAALRVWFNDGVNVIQAFDPHPLTSVPYAHRIPAILAHSHSAALGETVIPEGTDINNESHWFTVPSSTKSVTLTRGKTIINYAGGSFFTRADGAPIYFRPYVRPASGPDINGAILTSYLANIHGTPPYEADQAYAGTALVDIPADGTYTIGVEVFVAGPGPVDPSSTAQTGLKQTRSSVR
jgi:hypothetical protein